MKTNTNTIGEGCLGGILPFKKESMKRTGMQILANRSSGGSINFTIEFF